MSISNKHYYRFGYLKSDAWKAVRLEALVREQGKCQICSEESISNDAHHIWYPEDVRETTERHLVVLCRPCHEFVHAVLPECKTKDEKDGTNQWVRFRNAIIAWRTEKMALFDAVDHRIGVNPHKILEEINKIKQAMCNYQMKEGFLIIKKADFGGLLANLKKTVNHRDAN